MVARLLLLTLLLAFGATQAGANEAAPPASRGEKMLTDAQRQAVLATVRACWVAPATMPDDAALTLLIMMSEDNAVLDATIVPEDEPRADTPAWRGFARSALNAVTNRRCTHLTIPGASPGRDWLFKLRFTAG